MDQRISDAWLQAAADLGIRVVAPFELVSEDGQAEWFEAHILDFGGPKETVAGNQDSGYGDNELRRRLGYFASNLHPPCRIYSRQFFIDALDDWGWHGEPGKEPAWYKGTAWS